LITKEKDVQEIKDNIEPESEQDRNILLKQKKLLERIVYESLILKKE